jgi:hypothetical protein
LELAHLSPATEAQVVVKHQLHITVTLLVAGQQIQVAAALEYVCHLTVVRGTVALVVLAL